MEKDTEKLDVAALDAEFDACETDEDFAAFDEKYGRTQPWATSCAGCGAPVLRYRTGELMEQKKGMVMQEHDCLG
jgi:hypothetical protein